MAAPKPADLRRAEHRAARGAGHKPLVEIAHHFRDFLRKTMFVKYAEAFVIFRAARHAG